MAVIDLYPVRLIPPADKAPNIISTIEAGVERCVVRDIADQRIAVAVGSRGIVRIADIVRATVASLVDRGAKPFIVPAMGSHGGATADGQRAVLSEYGITADGVGAPVRASMETVELPSDGLENRLFIDRIAWEEAERIVVINRVKAHTDFVARHESGLLKMIVIGLGKHAQAKEIHRFGLYGLTNLIAPTAQRIVESGRLLFGVGIVEGAFENPARLEVVRPEEFESMDAELLEHSKEITPKLAAEALDILIVDELGKDYSGTGLDTNVIGRRYLRGEPELEKPDIGIIVVRRLSAASHGNALGMGLADIVLKAFADEIDYSATYENIITSSFLERGKLPVVAETDESALDIALRASHRESAESARIMHIRNTRDLSSFSVSEALRGELSRRTDLIIEERARPFPTPKSAQ